jgi:hypothetical protein
MIDLIEIYVHWYAGRSQAQIADSLGLDRKTVRKYLAPVAAAALVAGGPPVMSRPRQDRHQAPHRRAARPLPTVVRQQPTTQRPRRQTRDRLATSDQDRRPADGQDRHPGLGARAETPQNPDIAPARHGIRAHQPHDQPARITTGTPTPCPQPRSATPTVPPAEPHPNRLLRISANGIISGVNDAMARARADLGAGRQWKARDRLTGLLAHRQDLEVLDLLATVHREMQDLPAAGALWFVTGRDDDKARNSIVAWRERYGSDRDRWRSIPGPIRREVRASDLRSLQEAATSEAGRFARPRQTAESTEACWEPIVVGGGAIAFVLWFVAMIGIGMWTVVRCGSGADG